MSYIQPPKRIRPILRMMLSLVEKRLANNSSPTGSSPGTRRR